jgi:hypothetical protein
VLLIIAACLLLLSPRSRPGGLASVPSRSTGQALATDYLRIVRGYADTLIARGRDTYGDVHSPLFTTTLDRTTLGLLDSAPPLAGMRKEDRAINAANPMHDQNLYQTLYALTEVTGDPGYAAAADEALAWFFEHTQSPVTGLLAWGEHIGWDLRAERRIIVTDHASRRDAEHLDDMYRYGTHEYYRPWVLWDRSFALAPEAATRFARAVWKGHVGDQDTGEYDRHADYDRREPSTGKEFPRHGGFYIDTWAAAYEHAQDRALLRPIDVLLGYFERHRNPRTGILVAMSSRPKLGWPLQNLSLSIDLWNAAERLDRLDLPAAYRALPERMRASAARDDAVFLNIARDVPYAEHGFVTAVHTETLEPGDSRLAEGESLFTAPWISSYGDETDAQAALLCLLRYQQTGDDDFRDLFLAVANRYLQSDPDLAEVFYPGTIGHAITLEVAAYWLTGQRTYLERADHFGRLAVDQFFGTALLPAASTHNHHYEALTRGDTLVMALLDLWLAVNRPDVELPLVYTDR